MRRNFLNFLSKVKKQSVVDYSKMGGMITDLINLIKFEIDPSITIISFITSEDNLQIETFYSSEGRQDLSKYDVHLSEELPSSSLYGELMLSGSIKYGKTHILPLLEKTKEELLEKGFTESIIVSIKFEDVIVGFVSVLFQSIEKDELLEYYFSFIEHVSSLLSSLISSWYTLYSMEKEKNKSDIIIELSELALETTKIPIILKSLFKRILALDNFYAVGLFRIQKNEFDLYQGININEKIVEFFKNQELKIEDLPYYNHQNLLSPSLSDEENQYCLIIPVKSANIFLGFLFIVTQPNTKLSSDVEEFLRVVTNQLFLILQRRLLLDDIQAITQTSELSFFPVFILDKNARLIYMNYQFEKNFNLRHSYVIGNKIDTILFLSEETTKQIEEAISNVLKTLKKDSIKLTLQAEQKGQMREFTYFANLSPTINNLTGEYCVVFSLLDVTETEQLRSLAEQYNVRSQMYLNVLTHDIFNILFAIEGYYEIVMNSIPEDQRQILNKVSSLVRRGTEIVQHIRLLSKVLNTTIVEKKVLVPLRTLLETIKEKVQNISGEINLVIENTIESSIKIRGTYFIREFFEYIVVNLVKNITSDTAKLVYKYSDMKENGKAIISITVEGSIDINLFNSVRDVLLSSDLEYGVHTQLWLQVVKEIAKRNEFDLAVEPLPKNQGLIFKIFINEDENLKKY